MLLHWVQDFDQWAVTSLNRYAHASIFFDNIIAFGQSNAIFKSGLVIALLIWAWSSRPRSAAIDQPLVTTIVIGALAAIAVGRLAQLLLPMRLRPMHDPDINFVLPYGTSTQPLDGWSSFPSDHAVYFAALAMGIYIFDKRLGILAAIWGLVVVCLPRVYLGYHYPSDVLAGWLLGTVVMIAVVRSRSAGLAADALLKVKNSAPGVFYTLGFLFVWQMGVMFDDVRHAGSMVSHAVDHILHDRPATTFEVGHMTPGRP